MDSELPKKKIFFYLPLELLRKLQEEWRHDDEFSIAEMMEDTIDQRRAATAQFQAGGRQAVDRADYDAYVKACDELVQKLKDSSTEKLKQLAYRGKWRALARRGPDSAEEFIPDRHWAFLELDLAKSTARGSGYHYAGVRFVDLSTIPDGSLLHTLIREANHGPEEGASQPVPAAGPLPSSSVVPGVAPDSETAVSGPPPTSTVNAGFAAPDAATAETGSIADTGAAARSGATSRSAPKPKVGRPTSRDLVIRQLIHLANTGDIQPKLTDQAEVLANWLASHHPEEPNASKGTVQNMIRHVYNAIRAGELK